MRVGEEKVIQYLQKKEILRENKCIRLLKNKLLISFFVMQGAYSESFLKEATFSCTWVHS
jgi:hypothetical protein